eukprot:jgi/Mesvir1/1505/Mv14488-RA.1
MAELTLRLEKAQADRKCIEANVRLRMCDYRREAVEKLEALKEAVEKCKVVRMGDRERLFLQDKVNDILFTDIVSGGSGDGTPSLRQLDISTVARELGYRVEANDAGEIGKRMAKKFRSAFAGKEIPKAERFVRGAVRLVNCYDDVPDVRKMMEESVVEWARETDARPIQQRRLLVA